MRMALAGALALMATTGLTTAANAQSSTAITFNGDTTGGPTYVRPRDPAECCYVGATVAYQAVQVTVTEVAGFVARMEQVTPSFDTFLYMYVGEFDPTNPASFAGANDDFGSTRVSQISAGGVSGLAEGEYTIVATGWNTNDFGEYLLRLSGATLGWGPTVQAQLDELKATLAQSGNQSLRVRAGNLESAVSNSFATRNANEGLVSQGQTASLAGGVYTWLKTSRAYSNDAGRRVAVPVLQFGADVAINEQLLVGVALGYGDLSLSSPGFSYEGDEVTIQPYVGWDTGSVRGTASLTYGQIDYDSITTLGGTATAEGDLWAINANVARDYVLNTGRTITPFAEISLGTVKLEATSGTLAGVGLGDRVDFQEVRFGSKLAEPMGLGTLTVGLSADYYHTNAPAGLTSTQFDPNGWSGTMEVGYGLITSKGMNIDTNLSVSGIGGDATTLTGTIELGYRF